MADKYLDIVGGVPTQREATVESTGATQAGDIVALDAAGKLAESVMPTGVGAEVKIADASETLAAKDLVNIWNDGGTEKVRKANATDATKPAHGFVVDGVTALDPATVHLNGIITGLSGLTPGARQYLSAAAGGAIVGTAPSASGNVVQLVGMALSATEVFFEAESIIVLA